LTDVLTPHAQVATRARGGRTVDRRVKPQGCLAGAASGCTGAASQYVALFTKRRISAQRSPVTTLCLLLFPGAVYICIYTCIYVCVYVCAHVCILYIYIYTYVALLTKRRISAQRSPVTTLCLLLFPGAMYICIYTCIYVCVYVCAHVCILYIYIYVRRSLHQATHLGPAIASHHALPAALPRCNIYI